MRKPAANRDTGLLLQVRLQWGAIDAPQMTKSVSLERAMANLIKDVGEPPNCLLARRGRVEWALLGSRDAFLEASPKYHWMRRYGSDCPEWVLQSLLEISINHWRLICFYVRVRCEKRRIDGS